MAAERNPWLTAPPELDEPLAAPVPRAVPATGPSSPQRGIPYPPDEKLLPARERTEDATLWVVGTHGGAGESTLAELVPTWRAASHAWPALPSAAPARVLLTARSNARGLLAAQEAATQWASGLTPAVEVLGLVVVADAPGRQLPRPLRDLVHHVAGGVPRHWFVPWVEAWRLGDDPELAAAPRPVRRLVEDLELLLPSGHRITTERN